MTWFFTLLLIYSFIRIVKRQATKNKQVAGLGVLAAAATLAKMNLAFLSLLIPLVLMNYQKRGWIKKSFLYLISMLILILSFYLWAGSTQGAYPWSSFVTGIQRQSPSLKLHLTSFVAAFLYTLTFIIIGLKKLPYKIKDKNLLMLIASGLIAPIVIWPYVTPRFTYSLSILLFPIAANGIVIIAQTAASSKKMQKSIIGLLLVAIFVMGVLRMHLTFTGQSHLEFIKNLHL